MLSQLTRHDIQILRRAGVPQGKVAAITGASVRAVRDIEHEQAVVEVDDRMAHAQARVGRPSKAARFRPDIAAILAEEPELLSLEILRRLRLKGYEGRKSAMYALIHEVRPKRKRPEMRFEGLPGEFSQHDFGQVDVRFLDGTVRRVHFFASRLKYSRYVQVSLVPDECTETLVRALVDHFAAIGGIPLVAVFDRPKTVALKWGKDGVVTEWNPTFAYVALELGLGVEVCWPYQPRQKGAVENLVKWVKGSFFKQRRFLDEADLRQQLAEWHTEVNTLRPSRATRIIPAVRLADERLRPLKVAPAELALRYPVFVGPTAQVLWETNEYAMPAEAQSTAGTLYLYRDRLRIVAGRHQAEHERLDAGSHGRSTSPALRADHLAAVAGKRGRRYLQRQHLLDLGAVAQAYLTEIVARRPRTWATDVERLHELLQTHGATALLAAMSAAHAAATFGAEYVTRFVVGASVPTLAQPQQQEFPL